MHEALTIPDSDPIQSREAIRMFDLIIDLMNKQGHTYLQNLVDGSYSHFIKDGECDIVLMYLSPPLNRADITTFSRHSISSGIARPTVTFDVVHHGLYHSSVGAVPQYFVGGDGVLYGTSNMFVLNGFGQSYRQDTLSLELRRSELSKEDRHVYPQLEITPQVPDLGIRNNPIEPNDYELIGHYLHQIEEGEFRRL